MSDWLQSSSPEVLAALEYLGIKTNGLRRAVLTFEMSCPLIIGTEYLQECGALRFDAIPRVRESSAK